MTFTGIGSASVYRHLAKAGDQDGPDFVFLHVLAPHPPFVFGPNGEKVNPDHPYSVLDAAEFLNSVRSKNIKRDISTRSLSANKEVLAAVRSILQTSSDPPIIIIQGDHGPGLELDHRHLENSNLAERYPILYAYFIPVRKNEPDSAGNHAGQFLPVYLQCLFQCGFTLSGKPPIFFFQLNTLQIGRCNRFAKGEIGIREIN